VMAVKMAATSYYPKLFKAAYGSAEITPELIADALAQYTSAMATVPTREALGADPHFADPFK
jgi:cytochrome c peroxidase